MDGGDQSRYLHNQATWFGIGIVACLCLAIPDYRLLGRFAWVIYGGGVVLLALVFAPGLSHKTNGAYRWIVKGHLSLQPSEFAKLALIVALAHYSALNQGRMRTFLHGVMIPAAIVAGILGLVFIEPDWGTTILLTSVSGVMLLVAGMRPVYFWPVLLLGIALLVYGIWFDSVRHDRLVAWLHPELYKDGKGMQAYRAMIALGSGGVSGVGLGEGRTKLGFIPEHHTDFIYSVIGEEMGLVASLAVLATYVLIVVCGAMIAWNARDSFGVLLATGITFLIGMEAFINIGVVTGVLPNKGLALPFLSYGGSNLLSMSMAVGLLLNVARHARAAGTQASIFGSEVNPFAEAVR